jgi:hypothetical protein
MIDRRRLYYLVERYGDDPIPIIRNGLLGVARKRRLKKLGKDEKRVAIELLVDSWITALRVNRAVIIDWLIDKI